MKILKYNELINKLKNKETFVLYVGGNWCKNCRPVYPIINEVSSEFIIYNYDSRDNKEEIDDIRKCNNELQTNQYKELINLLNYKSLDTVIVEGVDTKIPLLKVPTILAIKDGIVLEFLCKEYLEEEMNDYIINDYKIELTNVIKKITHH